MHSAGEAAAVRAVSHGGSHPGCFVSSVVSHATLILVLLTARVGIGPSVNRRYRTAELFLKHPAPPVVRFNDAAVYKQLMRDFPQVCFVLLAEPHRLVTAHLAFASPCICSAHTLCKWA